MKKQSDGRLESFIQECAEAEALRFEEEVLTVISECESPIEQLLLVALVAESNSQAFTQLHFRNDDLPERPPFDEAAFFYPQAKIGPYRVDLAIWDASIPFELKNPRLMVVECDGHDFHEKTKEQARRDKRRDRFLQSRGLKVLHYTGSEIWADPSAVAQEIITELAIDDDWRNQKR